MTEWHPIAFASSTVDGLPFLSGKNMWRLGWVVVIILLRDVVMHFPLIVSKGSEVHR